MITYVLMGLGFFIIAFTMNVAIQLTKIEKNFKELYYYSERKVKFYLEQEDDINFDDES